FLDARADGLRGPIRSGLEAGLEAGARALVDQASQSLPEPMRRATGDVGLSVQLGAYSSRGAAEAAWRGLAEHADLSALSPQFEAVQRDGRTLVRLRAGPVRPEAVSEVCRAAGAGDWCASTARS